MSEDDETGTPGDGTLPLRPARQPVGVAVEGLRRLDRLDHAVYEIIAGARLLWPAVAGVLAATWHSRQVQGRFLLGEIFAGP